MKKSLLILLLGVLAVVLAACGGGGDDASGEAEEVEVIGEDLEDATELTFWTFVGQHVDLYSDAAERWNEENPDKPIKLVAETYPFEQMHNNLLLAIQSGQGGPDMVDIELGQFPNYLQGDIQLEPMNEYVEPVLDNAVTSRFENYAKDGNYYALPTHVGATVMFYNTEIMDEAGVDIDSINTWDDFVEAGKQVVENTDSVMWNVGTEDWLMDMWPMISQQDSDAFDENGELILDNQTNIDTLQFLQDVIYEHEIAEVAPGGMNQSEEFYGYFSDDGAASILAPLWYMSRFLDSMPDMEGKIAIRPMPAWEEGGKRSAGMGGTGTAVTNQAEDTELAKEFLAYAKLSEEGNTNLWTVLGFDPPRWDTWESEEVQADNKYYDFFGDGIFDMLLEVRDDINTLHFTENTPEVISEFHTNVTQETIRSNTSTPEEALKKAADAVRAEME
ncbi:ABC transporter substrate-binding protein [Gracilibacillus sp. S3-1-1]|uniref:ABC transporter substrate-binding protein n=1 Tax=Gracilibacillus pellucidus TaxID=3095368 RepID=A0ACC6M3H6_9BACI|nr:ABC transporter substrate-binding protein [Gracilibacillus sp. S3-1-1]MDX8045487.1 ABC transporter substrate-binding protein [Gracilibacillus sp. S3-1-1]